MSTGAAGNEIKLNESSTTLISAGNGSGKSSIMDAIVFALFGKSHRDVNKNQLINSINGKNCLVELWFRVDSTNYLIKRGIKPNVFEIYNNGELIDQEAATRDYQKFLEQHILKTNIKAFTQSVILGAASFTPFMKMRAHERREVIEDFLDIKIFGVMHTILKEEIQTAKAAAIRFENKFTVAKTRVQGQKTLIEKLTALNAQAEAVLREKIATNDEEIENLRIDVKNYSDRVSTLELLQIGMNETLVEIRKKEKEMNSRKDRIRELKRSLDFFDANLECPSCKQGIEHEHKVPIVSKINDDCMAIQAEFDAIRSTYLELNARYEEMSILDAEISSVRDSIRSTSQRIGFIEKNNQKIEDEILNLGSSDAMEEKLKLKDMATEVVAIIDEKTKMAELRCLQDQAYDILRDGGVKTTIVREYLPIINTMINQYLSVMEFFVDFTLDENFNEVVRSRCRDEFTYNLFSEGEKKRIDIAILFAWRQIAKMKNSVNCNILFLDEILDGALDADGLDAVFKIIEEESKHSNVFVISHNDHFKDQFSTVVSIKKIGDFSVIQ